MFVDLVPNRNSRPAVLLRESYREGDKVKKRTLANLSDWPAPKARRPQGRLRGASVAVQALGEAFDVFRACRTAMSLPCVGSATTLGRRRCSPAIAADTATSASP